MIALILAAGMSSRLRPLTSNKPKCLLPVCGKTFLQRSIDALAENGISDFIIVTGFLHDMIESYVKKNYPSVKVRFIYNSRYETTNNIYSCWLGLQSVDDDVLMLDSDLLFDAKIISRVIQNGNQDILCLVKHPLGQEEMKVVVDDSDRIKNITKDCLPQAAIGESLGIEKISKNSVKILNRELDKMINLEKLENEYYELAFSRTLDSVRFNILDVSDMYACEVDTIEDYDSANNYFRSLSTSL